MSRKEVPRAGLLKLVLDGTATNAQGAASLRLSARHDPAAESALADRGAGGLAAPQPRPAVPAPPAGDGDRPRSTPCCETRYKDFNDCHATEKLREVEGLRVSRESVRRRRRALGLPAKHRRRARRASASPHAGGAHGAARPSRCQSLCLARRPRAGDDLARRHRRRDQHRAGPALPPHGGSARLRRRLPAAVHAVWPAARLLWRSHQHPHPQ